MNYLPVGTIIGRNFYITSVPIIFNNIKVVEREEGGWSYKELRGIKCPVGRIFIVAVNNGSPDISVAFGVDIWFAPLPAVWIVADKVFV